MPTRTLSEHASKQLLAQIGIPIPREILVRDPEEAVRGAAAIGLPVALKLCGEGIAHKSERGGVRLGLVDEAAVRRAAEELLASVVPEEGPVSLLVAEMIPGHRELIVGLVRDPQFGPCVALGLGGILTEALGDVVFAAAPLRREEARALVGRLRTAHLIREPFRGEPAGDLEALADLLVRLGELAHSRPEVQSVDLNPVILHQGRPVAVDALVEVAEPAALAKARTPAAPPADAQLLERFAPLFHPRGIAVAGVSSHPGKFGFVAYHNLLRFGYEGALFPLSRDGAEILGRPTLRDISELPPGAADLVFVCTPYSVNP